MVYNSTNIPLPLLQKIPTSSGFLWTVFKINMLTKYLFEIFYLITHVIMSIYMNCSSRNRKLHVPDNKPVYCSFSLLNHSICDLLIVTSVIFSFYHTASQSSTPFPSINCPQSTGYPGDTKYVSLPLSCSADWLCFMMW